MRREYDTAFGVESLDGESKQGRPWPGNRQGSHKRKKVVTSSKH